EDGALADALADELAEALRAERAQLVARDHREAEAARGVEVGVGVERPAQARLDGGAGVEQPFLGGALERRAVEVALAEVRLPGVAVRVELDERERARAPGDRAQLRERDRMVAAQRERADAGVDERRETLLDAPVGLLRVARRHRQVAVVGDRDGLEQVELEPRVIGPEEGGGGPDRLRAEARARPEARRRVERDAEHRDLERLRIGNVREPHERADAAEARHLLRVERLVAFHRAPQPSVAVDAQVWCELGKRVEILVLRPDLEVVNESRGRDDGIHGAGSPSSTPRFGENVGQTLRYELVVRKRDETERSRQRRFAKLPEGRSGHPEAEA